MEFKCGLLKELYILHVPCNDFIFASDVKKGHTKKQRFCITSCFRSGSAPQLYQVCAVPRVDKTRQLFGKELSSICQDGKLPTAILVGSWFIYGSPKENLVKKSVD